MESEFGVYVALFTFRCRRFKKKTKTTELERRVLTKAECVEGGDEWHYEL